MLNGQHATKWSLNTPTGVSKEKEIFFYLDAEQELYQGRAVTVGQLLFGIVLFVLPIQAVFKMSLFHIGL